LLGLLCSCCNAGKLLLHSEQPRAWTKHLTNAYLMVHFLKVKKNSSFRGDHYKATSQKNHVVHYATTKHLNICLSTPSMWSVRSWKIFVDEAVQFGHREYYMVRGIRTCLHTVTNGEVQTTV
jgi:hypothetical protein